MLAIGFVGRRLKFLTADGIECIKFIVMKIILPVAVFHALGTTVYRAQTAIVIAVMLAAILISFLLGYLLRPIIKEPYRKYLPFAISLYEGGLMVYPLYTNLAGSENLSYVAVLDIACLLFGFGIYMGILRQTESGEKIRVKSVVLSAVKNPTFIATVAGVTFGATGLLNMLISSPVGGVYGAVQQIITVALSPLVLIIVGYHFKPDKKLIAPCLVTIAVRVALQAVLITAVIFTLHAVTQPDRLLDFAVILFMSAPTSFSTQSFLKTEEGGGYVATTNSLYCIITIIVYIVLACLM